MTRARVTATGCRSIPKIWLTAPLTASRLGRSPAAARYLRMAQNKNVPDPHAAVEDSLLERIVKLRFPQRAQPASLVCSTPRGCAVCLDR